MERAVGMVILLWLSGSAQNPKQAVDISENLVDVGEIFTNEICPIPERIIAILEENFIKNLDDNEG